MSQAEMLELFAELQPGDRVQCDHEVKVGFRKWHTTTIGKVVSKERRRHSLHFRRNADDKVYSDLIVLKLDDGTLSTLTLDEFSELRMLQ